MAWGHQCWCSVGQVNCCIIMIFSAFCALSSCPSMPKRALLLSLSFIVSIPIFIPPSSLTSPVIQHPPFIFSFSSMLLPANPRALHQTTTIPTCPAIITVIVASPAFDSSSRAEMVADLQYLDTLHTLVVYRCCG